MCVRVFGVFNAPFSNISVISWQSVVLVEETADLSQVTDKLYHIMFIEFTSPLTGFELTCLVVICIDCKVQLPYGYDNYRFTTFIQQK